MLIMYNVIKLKEERMIHMDFSSLVLIEKEQGTGLIKKELGSYVVNSGAVYVKKLYCIGEEVNLYFDTNKDVEDWEFNAIFDYFNTEEFEKSGYTIEECEDEYNPTWMVKFKYEDDYAKMKEIINDICAIIEECMNKALEDIKELEDEYRD